MAEGTSRSSVRDLASILYQGLVYSSENTYSSARICRQIQCIQKIFRIFMANLITIKLMINNMQISESVSCSIMSNSLRPPWTIVPHNPLSMEFSGQDY